MIAAIRVRGRISIKPEIKTAMRYLRLTRPNHCVVLRENQQVHGTLNRCKDYVTWGEISDATLKVLVAKWGRLAGDKPVPADLVDGIVAALSKGEKPAMKPVFRLHPPRKGWKNTKRAWPRGALGPREGMDELLKRMM